MIYIDDILVVAPTLVDCEYHVTQVLDILRKLGFLINGRKCVLQPKQNFIFLGLHWNTVTWTISLKPGREEKIRNDAKALLSSEWNLCRDVARFLGRAISASGAIPLTRAKLRKLQWEFKANIVDVEDYDNLMVFNEDSRKELEYWANLPSGLSSPISRKADGTVTTDATEFGIGILYDGRVISEEIEEKYMDFSVTVKELLALQRFLRTLGSGLANVKLVWRVDNNSALHAIRNEGSAKAWSLNCLAVSILCEAARRGISFEPIRISTKENIVSDAASRFQMVPDWSLDV